MTHSRSRSRSAAEPGGPGPCPGGAGLQPPPPTAAAHPVVWRQGCLPPLWPAACVEGGRQGCAKGSWGHWAMLGACGAAEPGFSSQCPEDSSPFPWSRP